MSVMASVDIIQDYCQVLDIRNTLKEVELSFKEPPKALWK